MKKDIADKWVKALRSGEYEQGRDHLKRANKYCCLGVLCEISGLSKWDGKSSGINSYFHSDALLPNEIQTWAKMKSFGGRLRNGTTLTSLNDSGFNFDNIADIIETEWETLRTKSSI